MVLLSAAGVAETNAPSPTATALAQKAFAEAQKLYLANPADVEKGIQFAQACFDLAEFPARDKERERLANQGIAAARDTISRAPKSAAAHYYLGMNLGQLARTKSLGALKLVEEMEHEFKTAAQLDSSLDFAGPNRNLGLLYLETPGWPASIGSKSKAKQHFERAVILSPSYPENQLNLLEAYLKWNDRAGVERTLAALRALLPKARTEFSGERWVSAWLDWESRWRTLSEKAERRKP